MSNCEYCGKEFEAKRSTAKYCSAKCRVHAGRGVSVTDKGLSVTDIPLSVTGPSLSVTGPNQGTTACEDAVQSTISVEGVVRQGLSKRAIDLIAEARARVGRKLKPEDIKSIHCGRLWKYTRHLSPSEAAEWFRYHRPQ